LFCFKKISIETTETSLCQTTQNGPEKNGIKEWTGQERDTETSRDERRREKREKRREYIWREEKR
jgi:hypothetical protein